MTKHTLIQDLAVASAVSYAVAALLMFSAAAIQTDRVQTFLLLTVAAFVVWVFFK